MPVAESKSSESNPVCLPQRVITDARFSVARIILLEHISLKQNESLHRLLNGAKVDKLHKKGKVKLINYAKKIAPERFKQSLPQEVFRKFFRHALEKRAEECFGEIWGVFDDSPATTEPEEARELAMDKLVFFVDDHFDLLVKLFLMDPLPGRENRLQQLAEGYSWSLFYMRMIRIKQQNQPDAIKEAERKLYESEQKIIKGLKILITVLKVLLEEDEAAVYAEFGKVGLRNFKGNNPWNQLFTEFINPRVEKIFSHTQKRKKYFVVYGEGNILIKYPMKRVFGILKKIKKTKQKELLRKAEKNLSRVDPEGRAAIRELVQNIVDYHPTEDISAHVNMHHLAAECLALIPSFMSTYSDSRAKRREIRELMNRNPSNRATKNKIKALLQKSKRQQLNIDNSLNESVMMADVLVSNYERLFDGAVSEVYDFVVQYRVDGELKTININRGSLQIEPLRSVDKHNYSLRRIMLQNLVVTHFYKCIRDYKTKKEENSYEHVGELPQPKDIRTSTIRIEIDVDEAVNTQYCEHPSITQSSSREEVEAYHRFLSLKHYAVVDEVFRKTIGYIGEDWREILSVCSDVKDFMKRKPQITAILTTAPIFEFFNFPMTMLGQERLEQFFQSYLRIVKSKLEENV